MDSGIATADSQAPVGATVRLDEVDLRILAELATDARTSQRALGRAIGMSPPAVADRIARLEQCGVIRGYRALLDWAAIGRSLTVTVGVVTERSADQRQLAKQLLDIPEVEHVEILTGPIDLRLRLRVRDQHHLREVFFEQLLSIADVRHTDTSLVMSMVEPDNYATRTLTELLNES